MYVLVPGYEVRGVADGNDVTIRLILPADKMDLYIRKPAVCSISPRTIIKPPPTSPRTTPTSESPLSSSSSERSVLNSGNSWGGQSLNSSNSSIASVGYPAPGCVTDSIDDWLLALTLAPSMGHVRYVVDMCERIKTELMASLETVRGKDFSHVAMRHAAVRTLTFLLLFRV